MTKEDEARLVFEVGPGFVSARSCPDCLHTRCGEDCVCNCDAAVAEAKAAELRSENERLRAQLAALTAERDEQAARVAALTSAGNEMALCHARCHLTRGCEAGVEWDNAIRARAGEEKS